MKTITVVLCLFTTFIVIAVVVVTIFVAMDTEGSEDNTKLGKYFKQKKISILNSIEGIEFVNISNYITKKINPGPDINKALIEHRYVLFPKSLYSIFSDQISIPSNTIIKFEEGLTLLARRPYATNETNNCLFSFDGVNNVTFIGNGLRIYLSKDKNSTDDFPVLCIKGSSNILIMDFGVIGSDGEGIVISGGDNKKYSENIEIKNVNIDHCKRGLRIQSVNTLRIYRLAVKYSYDKETSGAIKIAAENPDDALEDIIIENLVTERNKNSGLEISPKNYQLVLTIRDYESRHDSGRAPIYFKHSPKFGKVILDNLSVTNEQLISAIFKEWNTNNCIIDIIEPKLDWKPGFLYGIEEEHNLYTNLEQLNIKP